MSHSYFYLFLCLDSSDLYIDSYSVCCSCFYLNICSLMKVLVWQPNTNNLL